MVKYSNLVLLLLSILNLVLSLTQYSDSSYSQNFPYAEKMFKDSDINPRYDVIDISSEEAVKIIDTTLNTFELVSEKLVTPLHRVIYYPELEEYYPQLKESYDRLEDDDSLFYE